MNMESMHPLVLPESFQGSHDVELFFSLKEFNSSLDFSFKYIASSWRSEMTIANKILLPWAEPSNRHCATISPYIVAIESDLQERQNGMSPFF